MTAPKASPADIKRLDAMACVFVAWLERDRADLRDGIAILTYATARWLDLRVATDEEADHLTAIGAAGARDGLKLLRLIRETKDPAA